MEQSRDWKTSSSTRNETEIQPNRSTTLWRSIGTIGEKLQESNVSSVGEQISQREDVLSTTMCVFVQTFNTRLLTPVSSDVHDLESMTTTTSCLPTRTFAYPIYYAQKKLLVIESSSQLQPIQISFRSDFVMTICQLKNRQNWQSMADKTLKEGNLFWLTEDRKEHGYHNLC